MPDPDRCSYDKVRMKDDPRLFLLAQVVPASNRNPGPPVSSSRVLTSRHPVRILTPRAATTRLQDRTPAMGPQRGSPLHAHLQALTRILNVTGITLHNHNDHDHDHEQLRTAQSISMTVVSNVGYAYPPLYAK
jgi:hypothetical protein